MSKRIYFDHWGNTKHLQIPAYCMVEEALYSSRASAVGASVARSNGLICINTRYDGMSPDGLIFELTFGTRCKTGGYNVVATLWVRIPRTKQEE